MLIWDFLSPVDADAGNSLVGPGDYKLENFGEADSDEGSDQGARAPQAGQDFQFTPTPQLVSTTSQPGIGLNGVMPTTTTQSGTSSGTWSITFTVNGRTETQKGTFE